MEEGRSFHEVQGEKNTRNQGALSTWTGPECSLLHSQDVI